MKIYVSYIFRRLIILKIFYNLDTTNMVKTCDYLYFNKEIRFAKPLKMSEPCAGRKLRNKVLNNPRRCLYITLLYMKPKSPTISTVYIISRNFTSSILFMYIWQPDLDHIFYLHIRK